MDITDYNVVRNKDIITEMFLKINLIRTNEDGTKEVIEIFMSLTKNLGELERHLSRLLDCR